MRIKQLPILIILGLLMVGAALMTQPAAAQSGAALPTPRADGSVVHIVQQGDTMWVIAITYAEMLGMAPQDALTHIQELNNNPAFLNPGDEVIIVPAAPATATPEPTAEIPPTETPAAPGEATTEAGASATAPAETLAGTICVAAFDDANADGQRNEGEPLVADAAITIARGGATVSTYITDGASEPFCFELTDPDSHTLQLYPPAGFTSTTEDNWAVSIANGESYTVSFGLTSAPTAGQGDTSAQTEQAATPAATSAATPADSGGTMNNLGLIVMVAAAVLIVLAVVGVVLLRRG